MNARRRNGLKRHAIQRARERYGVRLELEDIGAMNAIIRTGICRVIEHRSRRRGRKVFIKTLCGTTLPAVYDPVIGTIVTFLPQDAAEVRRALVTHTSK